MKVIKKDGNLQEFDDNKILIAVGKSAHRVNAEFSKKDEERILRYVNQQLEWMNLEKIPIVTMHQIVETALDRVKPQVAKSYRDYRNYKNDYASMMAEVTEEANRIQFLGDKENSNADSTLVSTKRTLTLNALNKELYKKFFLNEDELQAIKDGYIYIHDMSARRDTMNCCLFRLANVLDGGFEMSNIWYNEPKSIDTAFDVSGDVILMSASQQYGGFTIPEVDKVMEKYAKKSYQMYYDEILPLITATYQTELDYQLELRGYHLTQNDEKIKQFEGTCLKKAALKANAYAMKKLEKEIEQGYQGWEYKFNTVASSRGDYPFITITFGLNTSKWGKLINKTVLRVHAEGQGKKGYKKAVLFPKLVFLYDEKIHGPGKEAEDVFEAGINCSAKTMYPDWLSMSGKGYISDTYQKYGKVISPMGCRAFLSPYWEKGGLEKKDESDVPVYEGRFNIGAISLHLPMILMKAREEEKNFYDVLDHYLEMIRRIHLRTYEYLGKMKASCNPLAYCEGGFYGGNLEYNDCIASVLKSATASFGITALNELQQLYNQKSIVEDGTFALEVMKHINQKKEEFTKTDERLYAIYGTPAESLAGKQIQQFRKKYGIIKNVSDREYVSNSFHCHVTEDITPIQKQDYEYRFWEMVNGGKIQYVKYPINYNRQAIVSLVRRAMDMGLYEGINLALSYCDDCGHEELNMDVYSGSVVKTKI